MVHVMSGLKFVGGEFLLKKTCIWTVSTTHPHPWTPKFRLRIPEQKLVFQVVLLMEEILHQLIGSKSHYLQGFIS